MTRSFAAAGLLLAVCACNDGFTQDTAHDDGAVRVEDSLFVELGGLEQWITIRGDDARNPVLLLVHGGPGDVQSPFVAAYAHYERDFVLVQWDQRGAGRTYGRYGDATPDLTLEQLVADGIELAEYLKKRFAAEGIVVVGHSWGTAIATHMVLERPDLFSAYVGTGQIASWAESVRWQFDFLRARAEETGDRTLLAELQAIGEPDPTDADQYFGFTRSLRQYLAPSDSAWLAQLRDLPTRYVSQAELDDIVGGMTLSGRSMLPFQMRENLSSTALRFEVPYYVIQGSDDIFTPTDPARAYFANVVAPGKDIVIIEGAGHFALVTHPQEFIAALREMLAP